MRHPRIARLVLWGAAASSLTALAFAVFAPAADAIFGCGINPICIATKPITGVVSSVAGDAVQQLAKDVLQAVAWGVGQAATFWMKIPTPTVGDSSTGQATGAAAWVQQHLSYLTGAAAVMSILIGAARIAYDHGQQRHHAERLAHFLFTYVFATAAMAGFAELLIVSMDQLGQGIVSDAIGNSSFADRLAHMLGVATTATGSNPTTGLGGLLAIAFAAVILGIIALLLSLVQILMMFARDGMLVLLVATIPLAAASSNTEAGMHWFKKAWGWLIAFALYKPAAAIVYAVAFTLSGQGGASNLFSGLIMLLLAVLALPALIKFVVPATSALAGGGGAGASILGGLAGAAMMRGIGGSGPTGAAPIASGGGTAAAAAAGPTGAVMAAGTAAAGVASGAAKSAIGEGGDNDGGGGSGGSPTGGGPSGSGGGPDGSGGGSSGGSNGGGRSGGGRPGSSGGGGVSGGAAVPASAGAAAAAGGAGISAIKRAAGAATGAASGSSGINGVGDSSAGSLGAGGPSGAGQATGGNGFAASGGVRPVPAGAASTGQNGWAIPPGASLGRAAVAGVSSSFGAANSVVSSSDGPPGPSGAGGQGGSSGPTGSGAV